MKGRAAPDMRRARSSRLPRLGCSPAEAKPPRPEKRTQRVLPDPRASVTFRRRSAQPPNENSRRVRPQTCAAHAAAGLPRLGCSPRRRSRPDQRSARSAAFAALAHQSPSEGAAPPPMERERTRRSSVPNLHLPAASPTWKLPAHATRWRPVHARTVRRQAPTGGSGRGGGGSGLRLPGDQPNDLRARKPRKPAIRLRSRATQRPAEKPETKKLGANLDDRQNDMQKRKHPSRTCGWCLALGYAGPQIRSPKMG